MLQCVRPSEFLNIVPEGSKLARTPVVSSPEVPQCSLIVFQSVEGIVATLIVPPPPTAPPLPPGEISIDAEFQSKYIFI